MASRGGTRAAGTDGGDHMHRERVASHYAVSALNKSRIKWTVLLHWLLLLLIAARLAGDILTLLQVDIPPTLQDLNLPKARLWELAWQPSILASIFAQLSLKRNNVSLLWQAMLGQLILGIGTVSYGLYEQLPTFLEYLNDKEKEPDSGFPFLLASTAWLVIAIQVHLFQVYFAIQLLTAWRTTTAKKSK